MDEQLTNLLNFIAPEERKNLNVNDRFEVIDFLRKKVSDSKPVTSDEFVKKQNAKLLELNSDGGLLVEPMKEFVIKAFDRTTRGKVFINITSHPIVEEPHETEGVGEAPNKMLRLPMSVGDLSEILDKKGKPSRIFDVIVNPNVAKRIKYASQDPSKISEDMSLFADVLFNYATKKFQIYLMDVFTCLKKCKYKGAYVKFQRVKGVKKPKISIVEPETRLSSENHNKQQTKPQQLTGTKKVLKPSWRLELAFENKEFQPFEGFNFDSDITGLRVIVELPLLTTGKFKRPIFKDLGDRRSHRCHPQVIPSPSSHSKALRSISYPREF